MYEKKFDKYTLIVKDDGQLVLSLSEQSKQSDIKGEELANNIALVVKDLVLAHKDHTESQKVARKQLQERLQIAECVIADLEKERQMEKKKIFVSSNKARMFVAGISYGKSIAEKGNTCI